MGILNELPGRTVGHLQLFQKKEKKIECSKNVCGGGWWASLTEGAFQMSKLAGKTMAAPDILAMKQAFSKRFC